MANDEEQLKSCLTKIIGTVETCLQKLTSIGKQQPTDVKADYLLQNSQLNNNIYTFALSNEENELLSTLTSTIQGILKHNFKHLSEKLKDKNSRHPYQWVSYIHFIVNYKVY
ncbi:unnamed protein product [Rotaria sp. Silwood1]|nr:unnamed protein product [Rotaria sp. Silwood1]